MLNLLENIQKQVEKLFEPRVNCKWRLPQYQTFSLEAFSVLRSVRFNGIYGTILMVKELF